MAELLTCRRTTNLVGGGTACQLSGLTARRRPPVVAALIEDPARQVLP